MQIAFSTLETTRCHRGSTSTLPKNLGMNLLFFLFCVDYVFKSIFFFWFVCVCVCLDLK